MDSVTEIQSGKVGFLRRRVVKVSDLKKAEVEYFVLMGGKG